LVSPRRHRGVATALALAGLAAMTPVRPTRAAEPEPGDDGTASASAPGPGTTGVDTAAFEARLAQTEALVRQSQPTVSLGGYVDLGGFVPQGNGAGYVQDFGHLWFPEYGGRFGWVFVGDILAPTVNTRGEVADLGDAPGVDRFDSINSRGAPGFIANEVNLSLRSALTPTALLSASVNFTPRTGHDFDLGDSFDVDLAQIEWLPTESQRTSLFVGKVDSVLGIEYRERKSDRRFGITPSLLARYTTGTALGIKLRTKLGRGDWLVLAVAVTNGSFTTEQFHFYDEVDSNRGKTASGRAAVRLPYGIEVGVSGSWGPQDRATDVAHPMWFFGPDLMAHLGPVEIKAQWLKGAADGEAAANVYGLRLAGGGYLEVDAMVTPSFGFLVRGEYRDALVWLGTERAYLTKTWRALGGLRYVLTPRAVLKAELLHNAEYGGIPNIPNDVVTSSLVMGF
jgi:hypothetical protein